MKPSAELLMICDLLSAARSAEIDMMWERGSEGNAMERNPAHPSFQRAERGAQ